MGGDAATGRLEVLLVAPDLIELRSVGFVTRAAMLAAHRELEAIYAGDQGPYDVIWDPSALTGYEPGTPALWARWAAGHTARVRRAVAITRSQSLAALVRALNVLLPNVTRTLVTSRAEALEMFRRDAAARGEPARRARGALSQTGPRAKDPAASEPTPVRRAAR